MTSGFQNVTNFRDRPMGSRLMDLRSFHQIFLMRSVLCFRFFSVVCLEILGHMVFIYSVVRFWSNMPVSCVNLNLCLILKQV